MPMESRRWRHIPWSWNCGCSQDAWLAMWPLDPDYSPHDRVASTNCWAISPVPTGSFCGIIGSERNQPRPLWLKQESSKLEKEFVKPPGLCIGRVQVFYRGLGRQ